MLYRLAALSLVALAACATAGSADEPDASAPLPVDALAPDAAPMPVTLSQNNALNIVDGNSASCSVTTTSVTRENSYYRKFLLSDSGVAGQLTATRLSFGVETASAQNVDVRLHTLSGTFDVANLTQLHSQTVAVPAVGAGGQIIDVALTSPVIVPAGSTLVAEVHVPDGEATGATFFIGSNTAGETGASYIRASTCGIDAPSTMASQGFAQVHIVLTVSGTAP